MKFYHCLIISSVFAAGLFIVENNQFGLKLFGSLWFFFALILFLCQKNNKDQK